jgi:hypothetical protein
MILARFSKGFFKDRGNFWGINFTLNALFIILSQNKLRDIRKDLFDVELYMPLIFSDYPSPSKSL